MRNRQSIEREIYRAREDLEDSLAQLKHVVQEKVDVKARARVAVEKGKMAAQDAFDRGLVGARDLANRGKEGAIDLAGRSRDGAVELYGKARERPVLVGAIVGGIVAVGVLAYVGRQRDWW